MDGLFLGPSRALPKPKTRMIFTRIDSARRGENKSVRAPRRERKEPPNLYILI